MTDKTGDARMISQEQSSGHDRSQCVTCSLSDALSAPRLDRKKLERLVDWLIEEWADDSIRLMCILNALKDWIDQGAELPDDVLRAFDAAAAGTARARDYKPPRRYKIVYAPTFVEDYAALTGRDVKEAREVLREHGQGSFHLEAVDEARDG